MDYLFRALLTWTVVGIACGVLYLLTLWTYRVTWHPLAKYPGPWLAKISDAYGAYHNARGQLHIQTALGHEKWGPVFRQGPNKLVFNSPTALHTIYHSKDEVKKSYGYSTMQSQPGAYNIMSTVDKASARFKRKILSQGFGDRSMRAFEPTMLRHTDIFVERLQGGKADSDSGWSPPQNMTSRARWLQYDVMGEFGFGQSFALQTEEKNRFLIKAVEATGLRAGVFVQWPALRKLHLDKLLNRKSLQMRQKYLDLMENLVKTRLAAGKYAQNDLFSYAVDAKDAETGRGFTQAELWAESRFLLIAGADTSSSGLAAAFFYLTEHPAYCERLTTEIRNTFQSVEDIRSDAKLLGCRYLRAFIDETMRLSPPISGTAWREVLGTGITLDGDHIPAGVDIGVNPYALHHNESVFADSFCFKPDRWIVSKENPQEAVDKLQHAFSPFSVGPRACAGRNMAYMEMQNTLARTLWSLDLRRATGALGRVAAGSPNGPEGRRRPGEFQLYEHITCTHDGPYLHFRQRQLAEEKRAEA